MDAFSDVLVDKFSSELGRRSLSQDMVSGLLFNGAIIPEGLETNKAYRLASLEDAEALGINVAYDVDGQSAYYQIQQYFRLNPLGDLFIMALVNDNSYEDTVRCAKAFQEAVNGEIRQMAIIFSNETTFQQTKDAVQVAQEQVDMACADYMPFEVLLEGKGFAAVLAAGVSEVDDLAELGASNVSVVVAMDVTAAITYPNTAAVGMALGAVSRAKVSENIAWVSQFNLMGAGFLQAGFVGGIEVKKQEILEILNRKRYMFAKTHAGLLGVYFNDSHTATLGTSDFAYIESNRTINKATRLLRVALLPKLNSQIILAVDGKLVPSVTKGLEKLCRTALKRMVSNKEVSVFDVFVDPAQDILATSQLRIKAEVTPIGTARRIIVDLGFKNPFGLGV